VGSQRTNNPAGTPRGGKIGITLGDPSGVGPEIVARTIAAAARDVVDRLVVFCDRAIFERAFGATRGAVPAGLEVRDRGVLRADEAIPGQPCERGAAAQIAYLEAAVAAAKAGEIGAIATAPINKTQARRAGFSFPGHTEYLAEKLGVDEVAMMFAGPTIRVVLATVHIPLAEVSARLTRKRIADVTRLGVESLRRDFAIERPRVGVLGLNPHAGEGGMFGRDEIETIAPAIEQCRRELGCDIAGPLVPDAAYRGGHDLYVAMYHDQALIPAKLVDFDRSVNVTLGLSIIRTSPDHGVAYDIAGTGRARHESFAAALDLAIAMLPGRSGRR
jgi:4-hydroxythreonine-4-phosphate dehydrogenase